MPQQEVHQCQCPECLGTTPHPDRGLYRRMNLLISRLDEQQRRWYAAVESAELGHGGDRAVSRITGLHVDSVDGKKKELIGNFRNVGATWCREPEEVNVYDFLSDAE